MTAPVVRRAHEADLPVLHALLREYYSEGGVQFTEDEPALRAYLTLPRFGFYVAEVDGTMAGCVLAREIDIASALECKRLYVLPAYRGARISKLLMDVIEDAACAAGFEWMYLDSKDDFQTAIAMYRRRGYDECARFNDNPQATIFLRKYLQA